MSFRQSAEHSWRLVIDPRTGQDETSWESAAMDQSDPKGAFGDTLARYYHQSESKTAVTS